MGLHFAINPELHVKLKVIAASKQLSQQEILNELIDTYVKKHSRDLKIGE